MFSFSHLLFLPLGVLLCLAVMLLKRPGIDGLGVGLGDMDEFLGFHFSPPG